MPEREALSITLEGGFALLAAGLSRERNGRLAADLILRNGTILHVGRAALNIAEEVASWSEQATGVDRPTPQQMAAAVKAHLLPEALASLQDDPRKAPQADELVSIALDADHPDGPTELFHDSRQDAFATISIGDHRETWSMRSRAFRQWVAHRYFVTSGKIPNTQALSDAINVLSGHAVFGGAEREIFTRIASLEGRIYLDLADPEWRVVEIDADGWRIVANSPVKFRRPRGMLSLPEPIHGSLDELTAFINVRSVDDRRLVLGWLLGTLRPTGPYAVLVVHGEQGSAKSTLTRMLRSLVDPNTAGIRASPRDERDLVIAANNGWCLAFDNVSRIPDWLSDAYCRVSTGGGFATRTLFENDEETIFDAQRPIILNGIEEVATRGDLLDRSVVVYLAAIPEENRRPERELWNDFERARPRILGALLSAASAALASEATIVLPRVPRMADFARWVSAAEESMGWQRGAFLAAYQGNRNEANDLTLDASPISAVVRSWTTSLSEPWLGTATDLLQLLEGLADDKTRRLKAWPETARSLANALRRLAPNMRSAGIDISFDGRKHGGKRVIRIERLPS